MDRPDNTWLEHMVELVMPLHEVAVFDWERRIGCDPQAVGRAMAASNTATCRYFWKRWANRALATANDNADEWQLARRFAGRMDTQTRHTLLLAAVRNGQGELACRLVGEGVSVMSWSERGQYHQGAAALLFHSDGALPHKETLGRLMLERGAADDFFPGHIQDPAMARVFLEGTPNPNSRYHWKKHQWSVGETTEGLVAAYSKSDPGILSMFLEAGYPGGHVDLLAKAVANGQHATAHALLDWEGFSVDQPQSPGHEVDWTLGLGGRVQAHTFWYAVIDSWIEGWRAAKANGWDMEVVEKKWPNCHLMARLLELKSLDFQATHPDSGMTAMELAEYDPSAICPFRQSVVRATQKRLMGLVAPENRPRARNRKL